MLAPGGCPQCGRRRGAACALGALPGSSRLWGLPPAAARGVPERSLTWPLPAPGALLSSAPKRAEVLGWDGATGCQHLGLPAAARAPAGAAARPAGGICCGACTKPAPAESSHWERRGQVPCAGRALALALGDALGTAARGVEHGSRRAASGAVPRWEGDRAQLVRRGQAGALLGPRQWKKRCSLLHDQGAHLSS